jgi:glutathione S-transferase
MKVTALMPDDLVQEIKRYSSGRNLTESLIGALREWLAARKLRELNSALEKHPLVFGDDISAASLRSANRNR